MQPEDVRLKVASRLMYGEDIRDKLPQPTQEAYHRYITRWPLDFFRRIHQREVLHFPLHYPQPDGPFYGYTTITIPPWFPHSSNKERKNSWQRPAGRQQL